MITAEEARKRSEKGKQTCYQVEKERLLAELRQTEKRICDACDTGKTGVVFNTPRTVLSDKECQEIIVEFFTQHHFKVRFPQTFKYVVEW